ncbi:hypothetical protein [Mycobacterium sp. ITM-2016-00318]|uniref:hypothetical protein n=1 Tax=Mycobacterium sp. ITM-2016-00318 TaxID=2099693 RepID=UPI000CF94AF2|nr:hypothetical protein [Mycobacterium sp. ITM-2016-00318]WNG95291.1 hypothetical protein C6A82_013165 [Mycobacterium sp. ITM-2016-00318]
MTYQDELIALADSSDRHVQAVYSRYLAGQLTAEEATALIAAAIAQANARAYALADLALAAIVTVQTGTAATVVGVLPSADDSARLLKAATTTLLDVTKESDVPEAIVSRLARSEPLESATTAFGEAMPRQPLVKAWVRQLDADPCQLCTWWWREGRMWPANHPMPRHKGCECVQSPVTARNIQSTGYTRRLERNDRATA